MGIRFAVLLAAQAAAPLALGQVITQYRNPANPPSRGIWGISSEPTLAIGAIDYASASVSPSATALTRYLP